MQKDITKGCIHVHVKNGQITNIFSHLSDFPENCIIHMKPDATLTYKEFIESHEQDKNELNVDSQKKIYQLGDDVINER
jgi:hypothetical protein